MPCDFNKRLNSLIKELKENNVSKEDIDIATKKLKEFDKDRQESKEIGNNAVDYENKYELFKGVFSNDGQTDFINKFKDWYTEDFDPLDVTNNVFVLAGRGGTGKSTSVGTAIKEVLGDDEDKVNVLYATPTNKASKVLRKALDGKETVYTIAQLLSMILKKQPDGSFKLERATTYNKKTGKIEELPTKIANASNNSKSLPDGLSNIIVVDEASMLSQGVIDDLIAEANEHRFKILFMGDNVQLPPVETTSSSKLDDNSPIFEYSTKYRAKLTERMRQGEDSPILKVTDLLAEQIESGDYSTKIEDKDYKDTLEFINSESKAIDNFADDFKKNPLGTRYIIFNNASNKKYKALEAKLKNKIYGENRPQYSMHEQLVFSSASMGMDGLSGKIKATSADSKDIDVFSPSIGDEYTVTNNKVKRTTVDTLLDVWTKTTDGKSILLKIPVKFSVNTITAVDNDFINKEDMTVNYKALEELFKDKSSFDKSKMFFNIPVVNNKDIQIEEVSTHGIIKVGGSRGTTVADVDLDSLNPIILKNIESDLPKTSSAMLINAHQSQGSTYDTVFTDISNTTNLIKSNTISYKLGSKAMYVSTSRPRNKLVMVHSQDLTTHKNKDNGISSVVIPHPTENYITVIQQDEHLPIISKSEAKSMSEQGNMKTITFDGFPYKLTVNTDTDLAVANWKTGEKRFKIPDSKNLKMHFIRQEILTKEVDGFVKGTMNSETIYEKDFKEVDPKLAGIDLAIRYNTYSNKWHVVEKSTGLAFNDGAYNRADTYKKFKKVISMRTREEILNAIETNLKTDTKVIDEVVIPTLSTQSKASDAKVYAKSIGFTPLSGKFGAYEKEYLRLHQHVNNDKEVNGNTYFHIYHIGQFLESGEKLRPLKTNEHNVNEDVLKLYNKLYEKQTKVLGSELGTEFKESQKLEESDFKVSEDLEDTINDSLSRESLLNDDEYTDEYREDTKRIASKITEMFKEVLPDYSFKFTKYRPNGNEETKGAFSSTLGYSNEDRVQLIANPNSRLTTETEVLLHETVHATLKGIFSNDPKLRNRVKIIRENFRRALRKEFDTEEQMVVFATANMVKSDLSGLYPEMKKRFDYVFSEESEAEEFMAYMLTNPSMREAGKMLNTDETPIEDTNFSNTFWGKLRKMFSEALKALNKGASTKNTEVTQTVENIFDTMLQARRDYELRNFQSLEDLVSGYVPLPILNTIARFGAKGYTKFISTMEKALKSKLSKKAKALILKEFNKIRYSLKNNKSFKRLMNAQKSSATISKILKSEVISSLWNQYFNSNVYSPDKSVRDLMRSFERIDAESRTMRASIFRIIENKLLDNVKKDNNGKYKVTLEKKAKVIKDLVIGSGLNKVFESLVATDLDRDSITADLEFLRNDIGTFAKDSIPNLDSLATYGRDRQSNSQYQIINLREAVGNGLYPKLNNSQKRILERYVITKGLSLMDDSELNSIKSIVGNQDVIHILKIINSTKSEYDSVVLADGYNEPFFHSLNPMSSTPRAIRIGTYKEAKAIGSRMVGTEPVFTVDNVKYYKYTTINYSPSLDSGAITNLRNATDGYPVSNILKKHFNKSVSDMNNKQNVGTKIHNMKEELKKNNIKVKSLIPVYSADGSVTDYIIPFDKNDVYVLQDTKNSSVEFLSNLAYHYKNRANKVTQKDRILIELVKHKVSEEDYNKDKSNYIPLGEVKGLSLDGEFYKSFIDVKVPRYLALYLTGAKRPSLSNMKITLGKHDIFDMTKHPSIKNILGISEKFLEEIFSEFKQQLTLFNTGIAIGNFSSNMYSAMGDGIDPVTFSKEFKKNSEILYEFEQMITDFEDMRTKVRSGELNNKDTNYHLLYTKIKNNKFFPLYKQGHITPTVDDGDISHDTTILSKVTNKFARKSSIKREIQLEAEKLSYTNGKSIEDNMLTAKRNIRNKIKVAVPDIIADIKGNLYGSDESTTKKVAEKVLIYGDVSAKMVMLEHRAKKNDGSFNLDNEIRELGELFVNYSHPASGFEQYMEKVTGFLFLKYLFRSLKGYYSLVVKNPTRIGLMTATGAFTGMDVSSPDDANFKYGTLDAIGNRAKGDDLDEVIGQLFSFRVSDILSGGLNSVYTTN